MCAKLLLVYAPSILTNHTNTAELPVTKDLHQLIDESAPPSLWHATRIKSSLEQIRLSRTNKLRLLDELPHNKRHDV